MKQRPHSITFIAWLFIVVGLIASSANTYKFVASDATTDGSNSGEILERLVQLSINCLAVVGGLCVLKGANWARWLLFMWMVFHLGLSFFHSTFEVLFHTALFTPITILLFRRQANIFFGRHYEPLGNENGSEATK